MNLSLNSRRTCCLWYIKMIYLNIYFYLHLFVLPKVRLVLIKRIFACVIRKFWEQMLIWILRLIRTVFQRMHYYGQWMQLLYKFIDQEINFRLQWCDVIRVGALWRTGMTYRLETTKLVWVHKLLYNLLNVTFLLTLNVIYINVTLNQ